MNNIQLLCALFFCIISFSCLGQNGFYVQLRGGYGIPAAKDDLGSPLPELGNGDYSISDLGNVSDKSTFGTLGEGVNVGIGLGYTITENLIVELGFAYTKGPKLLDARINTPTYKAEQYSKATGFALSPNLIIQANSKIKPYVKFGFALPIAGFIITDVDIIDDENRLACRLVDCGGSPTLPGASLHTELHATAKTHAKAALGFSGGAGVRFPIGDHLSFFTEVNVITLTLKSKDTKYSSYNIQAIGDLLPGIPVDIAQTIEDLDIYDKEIIYLDELTQNSNNADYNPDYSVDKPIEQRSLKSNLNNISLNVGVQYNF